MKYASKRRLSSINIFLCIVDQADETVEVSQLHSTRMSNSQLLAVAQEVEEETANTTGNLMPPPPAPPAVAVAAESSMCSGRPQRAAKLKSEKNLKEPSLISKMRRPSQNEEVKIKLESEQRASQMHLADTSRINRTETVAIAPPVESNTPAEEPIQNTNTSLRVMVKREKLSNDSSATTTATLEASRVQRSNTTVLSTTTTVTNTTTANNTTTADNTTASNNTTATGPAKRGRKKKEGHRPIKVERFSELDNNLPVASRTRKGSVDARNSQASEARNSQTSEAAPQRSIYEDAVEGAPAAAVAAQAAVNETVTLGGAAISEATFNIPTGNATMTVTDHVANNATFQVEAGGGDDERDDQEDSMETARQGSLPKTGRQSSLMTEDDSPQLEKTKEKASSKYQLPAEPTTYKGVKMPARTHELFK